MTLKEVILVSGLSKKSVYYYIEKHLIEPQKCENGYFNFSEDDVKILQLIRELRILGFSVPAISSIIHNQESLIYYLFHLQKEIRNTLALEEWKNASITSILKKIEYKSDTVSLDKLLDILLINKPCIIDNRMIDSTDAELLAYYFWGNFVHEMEITPYQEFLLEKLKQTIIAGQNSNTRHLRDYLYDMNRNNTFYQHSFHDEVIMLDTEQCAEYAEKMIKTIKKNIKIHTKMQEWIHLYNVHVYPSVCFFDDPEHRILMREISKSFVKYQDNINLCCKLVLSYLESDSGQFLRQEIIKKTKGHIDFEHHHSGEIAYLYSFLA